MLKMGYAEIVNAIIRPPRAEYEDENLGPDEFSFRGRAHVRTDVTLTNARGHKLVCSHWQPAAKDRPAKEMPCVIYLHGNSSCRLGALENLEVCLAEGITMFALDLAGSGRSGGDWVTLGWYERDDVAAVVEHLRGTGQVSTIGLWGRSMGAATALLHGHRDPSIAAMILDSPFASLRQLALEMVEMGKAQSGYKVPNWVISAVLKMVRSSVQKKAALDIDDLAPINDVDKCFIPALFVAAEDDNFIAPAHSEAIHAAYAGDKNLVIVPGDHNSPRPKFFQDSAGIFLRNALRVPETFGLAADATGYSSRPESLLHSWISAGGSGSRGGGSIDADAYARNAALEEEMMRRAMAASLMLQRGGSQGHGSADAMPTSSTSASGATGAVGGSDAMASPSDVMPGIAAAPVEHTSPHSRPAAMSSGGIDELDDTGLRAALEASAHDAGVESSFGSPTRAAPGGGAAWPCAACTYVNNAYALDCEVCGNPRGGVETLAAAVAAAPDAAGASSGAPKDDDAGEGGASGASAAVGADGDARAAPATEGGDGEVDLLGLGDGGATAGADSAGSAAVASAATVATAAGASAPDPASSASAAAAAADRAAPVSDTLGDASRDA